jgi:methyltransferase
MSTAPEAPAFLFFLGILATVGAGRLAELVLSRRHAKQAAARGARVEPERIFPAMVLLHTIPFWMGPLEVVICRRPFVPWLAAASVAALLAASILRTWALSTLGERWNVRLVRPSTIVSSGPYAFVRHPNYVAVIVELFFLPLVHTAVITAAAVTVLNAVVLARRIRAEEAMLLSIAGYTDAMAHKPRFLPSLAIGAARVTAGGGKRV